MLIVFDELTTDMKANGKLSPIAIQLLRERKINISPFLYHNLISKCLKYKTKQDAICYQENSQQRIFSTNSIDITSTNSIIHLTLV